MPTSYGALTAFSSEVDGGNHDSLGLCADESASDGAADGSNGRRKWQAEPGSGKAQQHADARSTPLEHFAKAFLGTLV
ncbi:hypothetical protein [Micromonospora sp. NPDC004704]